MDVTEGWGVFVDGIVALAGSQVQVSNGAGRKTTIFKKDLLWSNCITAVHEENTIVSS